jgi:chemotaxis protein methyltransferase CheR
MRVISSIDFDYLRKLVYNHSAVALEAGKEYLAELHLATLAQQIGFDSISELVEHLKNLPFGSLHVQVIELLLNYETSFFRDTYPFEILKNFVLPEIIKEQKSDKIINIWSAACSTGQEPYSIAMLIKENFSMLDDYKLNIIASDLSSQVLARASEGTYNQFEISRGLPKRLQKKYFYSDGNQWRIKQKIREMIDFRQLNLTECYSNLPKMDIILLRNVLIYFDIPTKKKILSKVKNILKNNGYLFLGSGETTLNLDHAFKRVQFDKGICYRL